MEPSYHLAWLARCMEAVNNDRVLLPDPVLRLASYVDVVNDTINGGLAKAFRGDRKRLYTIAMTAEILEDGGVSDAATLLREAQVVYQRALAEGDDLTEEEETRVKAIEKRLLPILFEYAAGAADAYVHDLVAEKRERWSTSSSTYKATVEFSGAPTEINVRCNGGCRWKGVASELDEIGSAILTPGDPSPAGRCPICGTLAYVVGRA